MPAKRKEKNMKGKTSQARRVLVIDPESKTITESFVSSLEDMQAIVGGRIERAATGPDGHEVYVNEEFLLKSLDDQHFFGLCDAKIPVPHPYGGKAFVIGPVDKRGKNQSATLSVSQIARGVVWMSLYEAIVAMSIIWKNSARPSQRSQAVKPNTRPNLYVVPDTSGNTH